MVGLLLLAGGDAKHVLIWRNEYRAMTKDSKREERVVGHRTSNSVYSTAWKVL
jgi:hypothetical protein